MKRISLIAFVLLFVLIGLACAPETGEIATEVEGTTEEIVTEEAKPPEEPSEETTSEEAATEEIFESTIEPVVYKARVVRVIDGDTIVVAENEHVRYIGMDTPEQGMPYYEEAKAKNEELVEGQVVGLELDVQKRDKYGRLLAYVWLDSGVMVNAELLRTGYAQIYTVSPNVRYEDQFLEVQRQAREAKLGLWGLEEIPEVAEAEPEEEIPAVTEEVTPEQPQEETTEPTEPPAEPTEPATNCDPSYPDVCIPIGSADYDCAGGSGNGPNYIRGPIRVLPPDPHGLDRDGDGIGCE